jgi:hypothetical protein
MSRNKHNKLVGSEVERSDERVDATGEVFTPPWLVEEMIDAYPEESLKNPDSKFMDNSAGSGNFLVGLKNRLLKYHSEDHILNHMLYAVEYMEDNHKELCNRLGVPCDHPHYVCADALEYHYQFHGTPSKIQLDQFF